MPREETKDKTLNRLLGVLEQHGTDRADSMDDAWELYMCRHTQFFPPYDGELPREYDRRTQDEGYNINIVRLVVDKFTSYLYGREVAREVDNKAAMTAMKEVWKRNNPATIMLNVKRMGGITGTAYILARWDSERGIKYEIVDSRFVTLEFDVNSPTDITGVIISYFFDSITGEKMIAADRRKHDEYNHYCEYITDTEWIVWINGERVPSYAANGEESYANPVGSLEAVFTVFRNFEVPVSPYGVSDVHDVIPVNIKLDERRTDEGLSIKYNGFPMLVFYNCDAEGVIRGPNRVLQVPGEPGSADYLTWDQNLDASLKHTEALKDELQQTSRLPSVAFGGVKAAGELRSAPSLEVAYAPAREVVMDQRTLYGSAEKKRIQGDLTILRELAGLKIPEDVEVKLTWPEKFLPIDDLVRVQSMQLKRKLGIETWDEQIRAEHPWMTDEQIEKFKDDMRDDPLFGIDVGKTNPTPGRKSLEQVNPGNAPERAGDEENE